MDEEKKVPVARQVAVEIIQALLILGAAGLAVYTIVYHANSNLWWVVAGLVLIAGSWKDN